VIDEAIARRFENNDITQEEFIRIIVSDGGPGFNLQEF